MAYRHPLVRNYALRFCGSIKTLGPIVEEIDTFLKYGYGMVIPPMIEYHDTLLSNSSEDLDLQTFKLIDQETGRQLGLRADITSQISRIYSTYSNENEVNRYCYFDHVVRTKNIDSKKSRIPIQAGAELIGNSDINNDAELVILMLDTVKKFTKKRIFLDLGHVGIFKKLMQSANLKSEQEKKIKELIRSKSSSEIKKYLNDVDADKAIKDCIGNFPKMHGLIKDIDKDSNQLVNRTVKTHGMGESFLQMEKVHIVEREDHSVRRLLERITQ